MYKSKKIWVIPFRSQYLYTATLIPPFANMFSPNIFTYRRIGPKIKWQQVAYFIEGRTAQQCAQRYQNSLDSKAIGNWSPEEDDALLKACTLLKIGVMETELRPVMTENLLIIKAMKMRFQGTNVPKAMINTFSTSNSNVK